MKSFNNLFLVFVASFFFSAGVYSDTLPSPKKVSRSAQDDIYVAQVQPSKQQIFTFCQDVLRKERDWFFRQWDSRQITGVAPTYVASKLYAGNGCIRARKPGWLQAMRKVATRALNCDWANSGNRCSKQLDADVKRVGEEYNALWSWD